MRDSFLDSLEYDEDAPDVKSIMAQIRSHVSAATPAARPAAIQGHGAARLAPEVYDDLEQARNELPTLHVSVYVTPSSAPLVGPLVQKVRRAFHRLVVFYVDRMAEAQGRINARFLRVLTAVVNHVDGEGPVEQVQGLEARIGELERRVESLEAAAGASQAHPGAARVGRCGFT